MLEPRISTRDKILDSAECLFAELGFAGTSVRAITSDAGVNLASAHYHFGSKEALIKEVFARRLLPLNGERLRLLGECLEGASDPPSLEAIVEAFIGPALRTSLDEKRGGETLVRLMGRAHTEATVQIHEILSELFSDTVEQFHKALMSALPGFSREDVYWKLFFLIGSMAFTMSSARSIGKISAGLCQASDIEKVIDHLIPFVSEGMRAAVVPRRQPVGGGN